MNNNNTSKDRIIIIAIVILVVALVIIQTTNNVIQTMKISDNSRIVETNRVETISKPIGIGASTLYTDTGIVQMCINIPPILTYDCNLTNTTLNTSLSYECQFEATDPNGDGISYYTTWITAPEIFSVTPEGYTNFTPKRSAMDQTNKVRLYTADDSECSNNKSYTEFNIRVVGENRAPYLAKNITNQKIIKNYFNMLYLTDYFKDPDDDQLSYAYIIQTGNTVRISFQGNRMEITGSGCGISTVYFIATDPFGLSASSNIVQYEVLCPNASTTATIGDQNSGAEGSGSGTGHTRDCESSWKCSTWSRCMPNNSTYKRCMDYNGCNIDDFQRYLTKNCTYMPELESCEEKWDCNEWSTCNNGIHARMCMDTKNCGTNSSKPQELENCSVIPSCFNGMQDQNETGVDCGGPCGICRNTESPAKTTNTNTATIIASILTAGIGITLLIFYRARIFAAYLNKSKKVKIRRKIYINNKQKEKLIQMINIVQVRTSEHKIEHAIDEISVFQKEYFKQLLAIDNLDKQELLAKIIQLKDKDLEKILVMFYAKIINITHARNKGLNISETEMQALIDESLNNIYLIAEFTEQEAINSVKDRTTTSKDKLDIVYNKISNLYIALKFTEPIAAKNIYKDILKDYETISGKDRPIIYTDIIRAFHATDYLEKKYREKT